MGKTMRCDAVVERLPWFLNGSLDPEERAAIREHLEGCPACRAERAATADAGRLFGVHPSTGSLVALAFGDLDPETAAALERHLAECAPCRAERALAEDSAACEAAPDEAGPERLEGPAPVRPRPARRWLAAAALVAALISAGVVGGGSVLLWQHFEPGAGRQPAGPRADHPVLELLPEELAIRGDVPAPPVPPLPEGADWVTVLLSAPGVPLDGVYRIELREDGATLWRSGPTAPDDLGAFSLLLPAGALRGTGRSLVVLAADGSPGSAPIATYRLP